MLDQQRNVLFAISERRYLDPKPIQAKIKVLPKLSTMDSCMKVSIGCNNNPHICTNQLRPTQTFEVAFFQHSKEHGLCLQRKLGDFIEKKSPPGSEFKLTQTLPIGSCKRTPFVAKQFRGH
jgi:hypothetical protein